MALELEWEASPAFDRIKELVEGDDEWLVEFHTFYSQFIEYGTGPAAGHGQYMPPLEPIMAWVGRKLGFSGDKQKKVAEAIRWKIYQHGEYAHPFARPAMYDASSALGKLAEKALKENEPVLHAVCEYIKSKAQDYIDQQGLNDEGTMAREIYVVRGGA